MLYLGKYLIYGWSLMPLMTLHCAWQCMKLGLLVINLSWHARLKMYSAFQLNNLVWGVSDLSVVLFCPSSHNNLILSLSLFMAIPYIFLLILILILIFSILYIYHFFLTIKTSHINHHYTAQLFAYTFWQPHTLTTKPTNTTQRWWPWA